MMKKNTFNSFMLAVSLLATSTACAPRREVNILTKEGAWAKASVSPMTARKLEMRRKPGKDSALMHVQRKQWGEEMAAYMFITYPLPVAGNDLPHLTRHSIKAYLIPEDIVKIEFQQPSQNPRLTEI